MTILAERPQARLPVSAAAMRDQIMVTSGQLVAGMGNMVFSLLVARLIAPGMFAQFASFLAFYLILSMPGSAISAAAALDPIATARTRPLLLGGGAALGLGMILASPWIASALRLPVGMVVVLGLSGPVLGTLALERGRLYASNQRARLVASLISEPAVRLSLGLALTLTMGPVGGAFGVTVAGFAALEIARRRPSMRHHRFAEQAAPFAADDTPGPYLPRRPLDRVGLPGPGDRPEPGPPHCQPGALPGAGRSVRRPLDTRRVGRLCHHDGASRPSAAIWSRGRRRPPARALHHRADRHRCGRSDSPGPEPAGHNPLRRPLPRGRRRSGAVHGRHGDAGDGPGAGGTPLRGRGRSVFCRPGQPHRRAPGRPDSHLRSQHQSSGLLDRRRGDRVERFARCRRGGTSLRGAAPGPGRSAMGMPTGASPDGPRQPGRPCRAARGATRPLARRGNERLRGSPVLRTDAHDAAHLGRAPAALLFDPLGLHTMVRFGRNWPSGSRPSSPVRSWCPCCSSLVARSTTAGRA